MNATELTDARVVELCDAAIAELEKRGLAKGWFMEEGPAVDPETAQVCTMGAFYLAAGIPAERLLITYESSVPFLEEVELASMLLFDTIPVEQLDEDEDVAAWNDKQERTVEDVILAIKHLRELTYANALLAS